MHGWGVLTLFLGLALLAATSHGAVRRVSHNTKAKNDGNSAYLNPEHLMPERAARSAGQVPAGTRLNTPEGRKQAEEFAKRQGSRTLGRPQLPKAVSDAAAQPKRFKLKISNKKGLVDHVRRLIKTEAVNKRNSFTVQDPVSGYDDVGFVTTPLLQREDRLDFPYSAVGLVVHFSYYNACSVSLCPDSGGVLPDPIADGFLVVDEICTGSVVGNNLVLTDTVCTSNAFNFDKRGTPPPVYSQISFFPGWQWDINQDYFGEILLAAANYDINLTPVLLMSAFSGSALGQWNALTSYNYYDDVTGYESEWSLLVMEPKNEIKNNVPLTYNLADITGSFGISLDRPIEMLSIVGYDFDNFEGSMVMSTVVPFVYDSWNDTAYYVTDVYVFGAPGIINLGTETPGYTDGGYDNGAFPERNVVAGIFNTYTGPTQNVYEFYQLRSAEFNEVYDDIGTIFCFALSPSVQSNPDIIAGEQGPTAPAQMSGPAHTYDLNKQTAQPGKRSSSDKAWMGRLPSVSAKSYNKKSIVTHSVQVPEELHARFSSKAPKKTSSKDKKNTLVNNVFFTSSPITTNRDRFNYPMSTLGMVFTYKVDTDTVLNATCTGTVFGPRLVAADAECLMPDATSTFTWQFVPAWQQTSFTSGVLDGSGIGVFTGEQVFIYQDFLSGHASRKAGVLMVETSTSATTPWKTYTLGDVTGWLGIDTAEFASVSDAESIAMHAAYSNSHFPGRIQVVMGTHTGSAHNVTDPNGYAWPVVGYSTDIFNTRSVPVIVNPSPAYRSFLDYGSVSGNYASPNILMALLGVQGSELDVPINNGVEGAIYGEMIGTSFFALYDDACTFSCGACPYSSATSAEAEVPIVDVGLAVPTPWWFFLFLGK